MARIDAGQLELAPHDAELAISLAAVPENWTEQAKDKGLKFTYFIDPAITRYHVDEERILQCVNILLANAISFTDAGRVHLHVTKSKSAPHSLTVVVADTGQGMSELVQSRLFTPFMQADTSRKRTHMGTGLNLAIAYALAEMMDGTLTCVSREGRGSEFTFTIPLKAALSERPAHPLMDVSPAVTETPNKAPDAERAAQSLPAPVLDQAALDRVPQMRRVLQNPSVDRLEAPAAEREQRPTEAFEPVRPEYVDLMRPSATRAGLHDKKEAQPNQTHIKAPRVLIVDDMVSNRDILSLMLEEKGYVCRDAADGYAALAALERRRFDFIILDIHMAPLDGIETLRRIRASGKAYANIPVIALTADNAPSTNAESMEAGADLFLTKPIKLDALLQAISYLRKAESTRILSQRA